jgi:hypothetical protein
MPKHQANLDFAVTSSEVTSQYDVDGRLGALIEIDRPPATALPLDIGAVNYSVFRGMVMRSSVYFRGAVDIALGRRARARLTLGDAPQVAPLRALDISPDPAFTAFFPDTSGVLDDHVECWFLTTDAPAAVTTEGLESVVGLGLSQEWLDAPKARVEEPRVLTTYGS